MEPRGLQPAATGTAARRQAPTVRPDGAAVENDLITGIVGFPDPWLFEQCGLPSALT